MSRRVSAALERSAADACEASPVAADGIARTRELVMGDPQAPFEKVLEVLDHHRLLGDDGRLLPEMRLISIGDHFDYGRPRANADGANEDVEKSGRLLLAWLAAHPPDQVTLIAGNHDLGRVGELATFDDARFARARAAALAVDGADDEAQFLAEFPELPSSEVARRDYSSFSVAQRELVARLLRSGRFVAAQARGARTLLCHAGVTSDDVGELVDAEAIARALNERLAQAISAWNGRDPLSVPGLHQPGSARSGEGGGIFYHRPCHPERGWPGAFTGPSRRRYDPRRLPQGIVQVIGHSRDDKCRELLGEWATGRPAHDGELRHLVTDGREVRYGAGIPDRLARDRAYLLFTDGCMHHAAAADYELFDLGRLVDQE